MSAGQTVAVFGAYGHTGRFVVAELCDRGFVPLLVGRDVDRLRALAAERPGLEHRAASVADPNSLDQALRDADAVVNCAGPFADTAAPVIEAALRAAVPYVDVAAEIEANLDTFTHFSGPAREAGVAVVPAMAFFGGLGDLLVTAAMGDWPTADEAEVAYGLSGWRPTPGTLASGTVSRRRREGRRVRYTGGRIEYYDAEGEPPTLKWEFPPPLGRRTVLSEFTMADVVTVPSHLSVPEVRTYLTTAAADDLATADTSMATAERDRPTQTFTVDVVVRSGEARRRVVARGQDIYAVSAPLVVEAVHRVLSGRTRTSGVASAGELFDAPDFLRALYPHVSCETLPIGPFEATVDTRP